MMQLLNFLNQSLLRHIILWFPNLYMVHSVHKCESETILHLQAARAIVGDGCSAPMRDDLIEIRQPALLEWKLRRHTYLSYGIPIRTSHIYGRAPDLFFKAGGRYHSRPSGPFGRILFLVALRIFLSDHNFSNKEKSNS